MAGTGGIGQLQPLPTLGTLGQLQASGLPSITPAQPKAPGWGWNPLTDYQKATSSLGSWFDQSTSVGGLNLGLGSVINTVANIVPGMANLAYQGGKDVVTGEYGKAGQLAEGVAHGLASGVTDTFTDLGTLGGLAPWTQRWENQVANSTHGYLQPHSLLDYARTQGGPGYLGGALNDALNLSMVADGAGSVAKAGDVGGAALEASRAVDLAQKAAVDSGATLEGVQQAKAAAQATSVTEAADRLGVDPSRIEQRLQLLGSIDKAKSLVQSITNPYSPVIKQLGRAANLPEEGVRLEPNAEQVPVSTLEQAAQEAGHAETAKAVAQQEQVRSSGPVQTLYRGENLSGAIPEANGSGYWYTDDPSVAREYAGPNGKVQKVDVPDFIAENTQSHNVLDENGNPVAKAYNLERVPHYDELARNLPPEPNAINATEGVADMQHLEQVPAAYKSFLQNSAPVPKWAQSIVHHLPAPMVNLLQWTDNMRIAHEYKQITRQSNVALGVVAREVENRPEIQALMDRAQQLMTDRIPGVTPTVASDILGERVKAAIVLGPMWEELEKMRPELDAAHPGLVDSILSFHHDLPPEYNTPEFRAEITQLADPIKTMRQEEEARLRGSVFHGERGLPTQEGPTLTKAERDLAARAQRLSQQAIEAEGAARQAEAGPMRDALTEAATALKEKADTVSQRIGDSIDKATVGRLGKSGMQKWQPLTEAADRLAKAAEQYPDVEALLDPLPKTFGTAMDFAVDHGFDPTHMPDMTPSRVRELVNGTARLGGQPGKEFVSSTRKMRTGALRRANLDDQSIEAIIGGLVHATQEERTNMVVDWIDRVVARPVGPHGEMPEPEGWVAWDETRRGMLQTENTKGEQVAAPGVTRAIPKSVARAIQEYGSTAGNPIARAFAVATDPWRFFMLTLNPAFYLHHISGHIMLSLIQEGGFHLSDWVNAYRAARNKFLDLPEVTGQNITQAELKTSGVVTYPNLRTAREQGGKRAWANQLAQKSHRVIAVSDSFARAVDYFARKREGYTDMEALQHANTALVDYGNLSNTEKTFARSLMPFYGFQKGILKIALKMPADHPLVTSVLMQIGKFQEEQSVDANGNPLPSGYQGDVNLGPLGIRNLKSMSPFKDLGSLTTPAGLVANLEYGLIATIRSGLNAPAPFTSAGTQVNAYGQVVPKVTLLSQLAAAASSSPQGQLLNGLQGNTSKGPLQSALSFAGFPGTTQEKLNAAGARNVLSQGEVANSTPKQQALQTAFPVDTQSAQQVLAQNASSPGGPLVPTSLGGQQVTQAQIMAALQAAQAKQQANAALTRAAGVNKMGVVRKKSSRRRTGGSSHRVRAHIRRASTKHASAGHVTKVAKTRLRQSFGKSFNSSVKVGAVRGGGAGGGLGLKSSIRGVPGLTKKRK